MAVSKSEIFDKKLISSVLHDNVFVSAFTISYDKKTFVSNGSPLLFSSVKKREGNLCTFAANLTNLKPMTMKKLTRILVAIALLFSVCACDVDPIDKKIIEAANCIFDDDYERALKINDNLLNNNYSRMSLEQRCDLAVLYYAIYGELGTDEVGDKFLAVFNETMKSPQAARKYYKKEIGEDVYSELLMTKELLELGQEIDNINFYDDLLDW